MTSLFLFGLLLGQSPEDVSSDVEVREKVIFRKETEFDLEGAEVQGDVRLPYEFFQIQAEQPKSKNLLEDRLKFDFRNLNTLAY